MRQTFYAVKRDANTSRDCLHGAQVVAAYGSFFFVEGYPWKKKKKRDGIRAQRSGVQGVQGTRNSGESREFV